MTNAQRRQIVNDAKAQGYQGSYVDLFRQAAMNPESVVRHGTQASMDGLRPAHQAGNTESSMAFTDVPPNTPFNTVGMKKPIDIKKYDRQGHLVKSYESVPPGIQSLDTGPNTGTVIETPARMQEGGFDESGNPIAYLSAVDLENYMSENRGNTPEFWKATADTIAYHENAIPMTGSMSLTRKQIGGGPGTGLFQFESKNNPDKDAFETAKQRYVNVSKVMPGFEPDPAIVRAKSAAELSKEQQYALFHANLIEGPAKLADYAEGKMDIEDLWLKGHKGVEKKGDRESFNESRQAAKKDDLKKYGLRYGGVQYSNSRYKR